MRGRSADVCLNLPKTRVISLSDDSNTIDEITDSNGRRDPMSVLSYHCVFKRKFLPLFWYTCTQCATPRATYCTQRSINRPTQQTSNHAASLAAAAAASPTHLTGNSPAKHSVSDELCGSSCSAGCHDGGSRCTPLLRQCQRHATSRKLPIAFITHAAEHSVL